jgi:DNA invertase Pin-like site-specific DNA recombinase
MRIALLEFAEKRGIDDVDPQFRLVLDHLQMEVWSSQLGHALDELEAGDVLVVTKLDRLARSTLDLLRIVDLIGKEGAGFKSLGDPWADTTTPHGKLMLTVLGGIAEFERSLILQRTSEGRARAMAEGTRFGRRPKLTSIRRSKH